LKALAGFDVDLPPIVGVETTDYGWRGITYDGEVLEMRSRNGCRPTVPESIMIRDERTNKYIGSRVVNNDVTDVAAYLSHFSRSAELHRENKNHEALLESNAAIKIASTLRARFNRAMINLALGRWEAGFEEFEWCERFSPFARPRALEALAMGLKPWQGQDLSGKRLLILHDHGYGDTLMMLRYVPVLKALGAEIVLCVPLQLARVAAQFSVVTPTIVEADYFVSFLHILRWLKVSPSDVPTGPYIFVDPLLASEWRDILGPCDLQRIGLAWSTRVIHEGDFPRTIALEKLLDKFRGDIEFHSVQIQNHEEAEVHGVKTHDFMDFADCAALMSTLDAVVSVDTAAIHLAGAIGHPDATVLLSHWHSWRWNGNPFYPAIRMMEM